ncbi:(d)CMP kinase [Longispora albida]|uniref:(d)CMP kinase n=1 Tax=Longispora albida TaxID=203523 RepID=UPI000475BEFD|nr:(d)CMP kinase [Longispora albida]
MSVFRGVVAVDGPSGSGKSTVSRRLASALGAAYLDTGAMYRAATWAVLTAGADPADPDAVMKIVESVVLEIGTDPAAPHMTVDGTSVDAPIRGGEVTAAVSAVAAVPGVRELLVSAQRTLITQATAGIVVEGRDIGTVVAPDAVLKVYLTADVSERARRRSQEHDADHEATAADLVRRDNHDSGRKADPLRRADDAVELDTTAMSIDEVVAHLLNLLGRSS